MQHFCGFGMHEFKNTIVRRSVARLLPPALRLTVTTPINPAPFMESDVLDVSKFQVFALSDSGRKLMELIRNIRELAS